MPRKCSLSLACSVITRASSLCFLLWTCPRWPRGDQRCLYQLYWQHPATHAPININLHCCIDVFHDQVFQRFPKENFRRPNVDLKKTKKETFHARHSQPCLNNSVDFAHIILLGKPSNEKNGNILVFYQYQFPVFSWRKNIYSLKIIYMLQNM